MQEFMCKCLCLSVSYNILSHLLPTHPRRLNDCTFYINAVKAHTLILYPFRFPFSLSLSPSCIFSLYLYFASSNSKYVQMHLQLLSYVYAFKLTTIFHKCCASSILSLFLLLLSIDNLQNVYWHRLKNIPFLFQLIYEM